MKLQKKLVTRVKDLREERNITQQELADLVGISRQTVYYLEKGSYNPSLTISLKISKLFNKSIEDIFYFEPVIKDLLGCKTLEELEVISENSGIETERLIKLKNIDDDNLLKAFNEKELYSISQAIGVSFDTIFLKDDLNSERFMKDI
ncbi:MAG: helix-turn-helix transcriptional regulator [Promethearchaeota archaeon]